MTDWTKEEDEAFNVVEQQSNLWQHGTVEPNVCELYNYAIMRNYRGRI